MKLSVLDQAPISRGDSPDLTLAHTLELAQWTESLGYHRYWIAEHHNTNGLASSSPEIVMTRIASVTNSIRVGSGGVLLPQYSPYKIAENFKTLEAFFPGRIDLGVGRSPGGSQLTRSALTDNQNKSMKDFPRQLTDLQGFLHNALPREHPFRLVKAGPRINHLPPIWVLGLSERGAIHAAEIGAGFVFGHFINPKNGHASIQSYKKHFQPSETMPEPKVIACVFVVCAETEKEAEELAMTQDKWLWSVGKGADTKVPSIEEVKKKAFTEEQVSMIQQNRERCVIGTPDQVKSALQELQHKYQADEIMVITNIHDFEAKKKSYQLLAEFVQPS
ncbi:LLM class flavin-dependent oxidoreductase [Gracilibacillus caseinilyticus]|uniref:LLM class flavin-dependent oxidoreductase n=1 Tax=Gracilibacillus caseinilyticus TaxID=2932256 RepID=A0ABY4ESY9_9BACI|nr:LLM class flavin-dependent oxidoreductase [Gracilibacillus caseinilyticus]UOQ46992.1 LLM class flavin-dependent oxidoreductase [Gracilibacillus caseinilyticus]